MWICRRIMAHGHRPRSDQPKPIARMSWSWCCKCETLTPASPFPRAEVAIETARSLRCVAFKAPHAELVFGKPPMDSLLIVLARPRQAPSHRTGMPVRQHADTQTRTEAEAKTERKKEREKEREREREREM